MKGVDWFRPGQWLGSLGRSSHLSRLSRLSRLSPPFRFSLLPLLSVLGAGAACAQTSDELTGTAHAAASSQALLQACSELTHLPWATQPTARRAQLQRLEAARSLCIGHAGFLATLGGLWLEEGEPNQALIWLERSLLLDPDNLGAQADHALALAALGEQDGLRALTQAWRGRTDVPPALRNRLAALLVGVTAGVTAGATDGAANGVVNEHKDGHKDGFKNGGRAGVNNGHWASYREATVLLGYESNLDRSPKLAEITLTVPGGPIDLPLLNPLKPRRGAALIADVSWQLARSPEPGQIWRTGLNLGTRSAPGENNTDWYNIQWAASGSQRWGPWRGQLDVAATWIRGPLSEPYRLLRASASGERNALGCMLRMALDAETRTQTETISLNGRTLAASWSGQCQLPSAPGWSWGAVVRASADNPPDATRPGGPQRFWSLGTRLAGPLPGGARFEVNLRRNQARDAQGYSPLLENDARRQLIQTQLSFEYTRPVTWGPGTGAEALLQMQAVRQQSNLAVFRYTSVSTYGGLRWSW